MLQDFMSASALYLYPLLAGLCLGVLQIVVYFAGSVSLGDSVADMIDGTSIGELFDWLNFGRVPFSILGMLLLTTFGASGMLVDGTVPGLPAWAYLVVAVPASVTVTKLVGNGIAKVLPRDESYAVTREHMIGRRGVVTLGPLDDGVPGAIRVRDEHGDLHTIKARPADEGSVIQKGAEVVVVSATPGSDRIFLVIPFTSD
ncbi:OB-fold-containig protein [Aminobacter ciceronei]|jgi:membrane protein implicated in regulation of membrane protease activity|uniref:OB-fold-containig protein n=1 Tax=Aminobacter ciceronei TaxID=150723 RepID=UPI003F6EDE0D